MKQKLDRMIQESASVAISGHIRPDGDCVGSCMGLYLYIKERFPAVQADVYLQEIPACFRILSGTDQIRTDCTQEKTYDLFVALDCGDAARLGDAEKYFASAKQTVCVDHHISNAGFAQEDYIVADASSTSELLYGLLDPDFITKEIAEALYLGIAHDTGVFQYGCTSPETMQTAGKLMAKGIDFSDLVNKTYYEKTYLQQQILGRALLESIRLMDGKCIISGLRKRDIDFYGVTDTDMDGISAQLRNTTGVEVSVFLHETKFQEFRVSMRSKGEVDVQKVAKYFGGGGHVRAAGCMMQGTMHDVINNLTGQIEKQMVTA